MIDRWGAGYFHANPEGDMTVAPLQQKGIAVPIIDVVREAQTMNMATPILIRFQDLLRHRVETLNGAFSRAIADNSYRGSYRGVFPLKVNQLREVVVRGTPYGRGGEAGMLIVRQRCHLIMPRTQ